MNAPKTFYNLAYKKKAKEVAQSFKGLRGSVEVYACCDTLQVEDYSKFNMASFSEDHKRAVRKKQFPADLGKAFEMGLSFHELFSASPHVFLRAKHPLAGKESVTLKDLQAYPRLNFLQGSYESADFSEEPFSTEPSEKEIRVSDRAAIVNLMIGLDGYTISSGIFPQYLQGRRIIAVPLAEKEKMHIGYVLCRGQDLSELGAVYVEALKKYAPWKP